MVDLPILGANDMRTTGDPQLTLLSFYESVYRAGASRASSDIAALATATPTTSGDHRTSPWLTAHG